MSGPRLQVRELGTVPYSDGLALQADLVRRRRAGEIPDQLLLLEHPHVITMGSGGSAAHVLADTERLSALGIEVHRTGRGGDVTYHGPGQVVGYPVLALEPDRRDLHRYLRDLEEMLIRAAVSLGVTGARRRQGLTGVWLPEGKVAAIGVRVSSGWITSHGFALNVDPELAYFETIVPCGLPERVTSLRAALGVVPTPGAVRSALVQAFEPVFGRSAEPAPHPVMSSRQHSSGPPAG